MSTSKFLFYTLGIFASYTYFGVLQEKINKSKYSTTFQDDNGVLITKTEKFTFALTLVLVQSFINFIVAKLALLIWPKGEDKTPQVYYASMSLTYLLAMVCSNMSLQWVSYPTQVVGKSAKPIPVMILGVLLGNKSYPLRKYIFVLMIVFGIVLFILKDQTNTPTEESSIGIGELLLFLSLTMDGILAAIQERIRALSKPSGLEMMYIGNAWSTLFLAVAVLVSKEYVGFLDFAHRYPFVLNNLLILGLTSAVGQLFLFSMVSDFGPLSVSVVTTTRKFFTVLLSIMIFGNHLTGRQWFGTITVFLALFLDAFYSKKAPPPKNK